MTYTYSDWLALGEKLKKDKKVYLNPTSYETAYPERVKGHAYYRQHPELLTMQKRTELIVNTAQWMVRHIADSAPQWRGY